MTHDEDNYKEPDENNDDNKDDNKDEETFLEEDDTLDDNRAAEEKHHAEIAGEHHRNQQDEELNSNFRFGDDRKKFSNRGDYDSSYDPFSRGAGYGRNSQRFSDKNPNPLRHNRHSLATTAWRLTIFIVLLCLIGGVIALTLSGPQRENLNKNMTPTPSIASTASLDS